MWHANRQEQQNVKHPAWMAFKTAVLQQKTTFNRLKELVFPVALLDEAWSNRLSLACCQLEKLALYGSCTSINSMTAVKTVNIETHGFYESWCSPLENVLRVVETFPPTLKCFQLPDGLFHPDMSMHLPAMSKVIQATALERLALHGCKRQNFNDYQAGLKQFLQCKQLFISGNHGGELKNDDYDNAITLLLNTIRNHSSVKQVDFIFHDNGNIVEEVALLLGHLNHPDFSRIEQVTFFQEQTGLKSGSLFNTFCNLPCKPMKVFSEWEGIDPELSGHPGQRVKSNRVIEHNQRLLNETLDKFRAAMENTSKRPTPLAVTISMDGIHKNCLHTTQSRHRRIETSWREQFLLGLSGEAQKILKVL
jgi:hypothetical protein